ncbi:MAG: asparaginase [Calditrichota bacterium]
MNQSNYLSIPPVVVSFTRGGIVESRHRGYACVADSDGNLRFSLGDPDYVTFLRSSAKPLQAIAAITSGAAEYFGLTEWELAIISGSHGGEDIHVDTVQSILNKLGLDANALHCGIHPPLDNAAKEALEKSNQPFRVLHHNCSGKHAGMLAAALVDGIVLDNYLDPDSPVQRRITGLIAELAGIQPQDVVIGLDGCSSPVHGLSMQAAARTFARLVDPQELTPGLKQAAERVVQAMRTYPEMVAARQGRVCTQLILAGAHVGMIAKAGAEGYYMAAWIDPQSGKGMGLTLKIEDGAQRARDPLTMAILQRMGVLDKTLPANLASYGANPITNWAGKTVGEVMVDLGQF